VSPCAVFCRGPLAGVNRAAGLFSAEKRCIVERTVRTSSRNFAVLLFDEVDLYDVACLMQVASVAGRHYNWRPFRLLSVARQAGLVETRSQLRVEAKLTFADCPAPELLFVPGGYGARRAAEDETTLDFCRRAAQTAETLLAVGAGVAVLGAAGLLEGARVAASNDVRGWLAPRLPNTSFDDQPLVASPEGKILTAAGSGHGIELALSVVERQLGRRMAVALRANLGLADVSRLDLPEPVKITLPPR
jgi:transcriptional regulator GlxA family with amidase domain